jgi:hypothetical protein
VGEALDVENERVVMGMFPLPHHHACHATVGSQWPWWRVVNGQSEACSKLALDEYRGPLVSLVGVLVVHC